jgi:hypothetical protein
MRAPGNQEGARQAMLVGDGDASQRGSAGPRGPPNGDDEDYDKNSRSRRCAR